MMMIPFVKRVLFWASHRAMYADYKEILAINRKCTVENLEAINRQLTQLLEHAISTTNYWRDCRPVLSDFPVISKNIVIDHRADIFSSKYIDAPLHEMHTSGSTGIPFVLQQDLRKRQRVIAEIKAMNEQAEYHSHEKMLYIAGGNQPRASTLKQQREDNIYKVFVKTNDDETIGRIVSFLLEERPVAIHASASNIPPILDYIKAHNIGTKRFSIKAVITGGEMVPEKLCEDIRLAFGEKTIVAVKYSNEEMGIMAQKTDGEYIWNHADYYVEILKLDSDMPCSPGEFGRIVVTDLYNFATPLIRYDTGDCGTLRYVEGEYPVLTDLSGKRRDLIYTTSGVSISGAAMTNIFKNVRKTRLWQLIQDGERHYVYKIVPERNEHPTNEDILLDDLRDLLGDDAQIDVEFENEIPTISSGKRRYTVQLFKSQ